MKWSRILLDRILWRVRARTDEIAIAKIGKAKLAPRPETSVPRLELCAAVLAVEIAETIEDEIDTKLDSVTFYSDSKFVLGYICNESRKCYVYVNNRVQRIRKSTHPKEWKYVQWGKKVFCQPPIVQVLPLKKMREACNTYDFHHMYTSTMRGKIRKKNPENHIVGFLKNLFANDGGK